MKIEDIVNSSTTCATVVSLAVGSFLFFCYNGSKILETEGIAEQLKPKTYISAQKEKKYADEQLNYAVSRMDYCGTDSQCRAIVSPLLANATKQSVKADEKYKEEEYLLQQNIEYQKALEPIEKYQKRGAYGVFGILLSGIIAGTIGVGLLTTEIAYFYKITEIKDDNNEY